MRKLISALFVIAFAAASLGADSGSHKPYSGGSQFEKLKKLSGKWKGMTKMMGNEQEVEVDYAVTSGGSVLMEKLFSGTPHEMVSMYYEKDGKPRMTHFCMMYNRPEMELKSETP